MKNERKEQEQEIMAQMQEAMQEEKPTQAEMPKKNGMQIHCYKCKTLMENGKCPSCGHTVYVPMDEQKQKNIRWIAGGILFAVFLIVFLFVPLTIS